MRELRALVKYLKRYRWPIVVGITALVAIDLLQLYVPRIVRIAIDGLADGKIDVPGLARVFLLIMAVSCAIAFGRFWWRFCIIGTARRIERALRTDLYSHLTTLDVSFFDRTKTGDLMAHAVNDINAVRMSLGFGLVILTDIVILGVASIVLMVDISPRLTLYALIPFPLITLFSTRFGRIIHRLFETVQESFALLTERVRENLSGIRVVKIFVQEQAEMERFQALSEDYVARNISLVRVWGMFFPLIMSLAAIGEVIVIALGGRLVITGQLSIGSFVAFITYVQMLVWPMVAIGRAINMFQRGSASQGRLNRLFAERPGIVGGSVVRAPGPGTIRFEGVSFRYPGKETVALDQVTLELPAGKILGVTGSIGSGKSTLLSLLLRLYDPDQGRILLDGTDIKILDIAALRSHFAFVPQDTFLFSDSIRANIALGDGNASADQIERVARVAQLHDEIMQFTSGYETQIGERGITLSGGQKQRLALARALLLERPAIVLDDAFSAVDSDTERRIIDAIKSELKGRSAIIVSHRIFAIRDANYIVVLDQGRIVEQGTHRELLKKQGRYAGIYRAQQIEMKLEAL